MDKRMTIRNYNKNYKRFLVVTTEDMYNEQVYYKESYMVADLKGSVITHTHKSLKIYIVV